MVWDYGQAHLVHEGVFEAKITSLLAEAMDPHLASTEDLETVGYVLHFHEIRDVPRSINHPVVDLLVSGHRPDTQPNLHMHNLEDEERK